MPDLHKAAVLLMSLPEDEAAMLMGKLDQKQVEEVSIEIARTKQISHDEQEAIIKEFANSTRRAGPTVAALISRRTLSRKHWAAMRAIP